MQKKMTTSSTSTNNNRYPRRCGFCEQIHPSSIIKNDDPPSRAVLSRSHSDAISTVLDNWGSSILTAVTER
uniref:Uncharacterized protein n=1 Tax=Globodera rostochiensis TaxID=31243 RepID=A0A914H0L2_GLORO